VSTATTEVDRIMPLAESFPCLRGAPGVRPWDADKLAAWVPVASHGERCAALFVLHVWNHIHVWPCGSFDIMEAINIWDEGNLAAFQRWAADPFTL